MGGSIIIKNSPLNMATRINKKLILGVDIGGSKINIVVWNGSKIIDRWQTKGVSLTKIKEGLSRFPVSHVGIGVAGVLDYKKGRILNSPNLKFLEGWGLKRLLNRNVRFDNDVHCFLRAEARLGAARDYHHVLAVAMGTGIGGAIIINKKPVYQGAHGSAGEFGQMVLLGGKTWEELYRASKGQASAQARLHALAFANLINVFDPEIIVLGGGGASWPKRELMNKLILSPLAKKTKIVSAKLGLDAVATGAALLWMDKNKT